MRNASKWIGLFLIAAFIFYIISTIGQVKVETSLMDHRPVGSKIIFGFQFQTGSANSVTSVVVLYRGFDTLGEVTVLFLAALGVALLLGTANKKDKIIEDENFVLKTASGLLFPFIFLLGANIIIHGHLSPGGGFPGGVVIATGFFVVLLTSKVKYHEMLFIVFETLAGLSFIGLGLVGLFGPQQSFLANFLGTGIPKTLISAGVIPLIYAVIGIKVAVELSGAVSQAFLYQEEEE